MQFYEATLSRFRLNREDVIRMTGSNAPKVPPVIKEPSYRPNNQKVNSERLRNDQRFILFLSVMGWTGTAIGLTETVTREAIDKRLRKIGLLNPKGKMGRPKGRRFVLMVKDGLFN